MAVPEYCADCSTVMDVLGSCVPPGVSPFFAVLSLIPYLTSIGLPFYALSTRSKPNLAKSLVVIFYYCLNDIVLKRVFAKSRPELSCKKSYGFPSSHSFVYWVLLSMQVGEVALSTLAGLLVLGVGVCYSRMALNYHSLDQVVAGALLGLVVGLPSYKFVRGLLPRDKDK